MKTNNILPLLLFMSLGICPLKAQQGMEIYSKGYNSTPWEIERYGDGTWLFITTHAEMPGSIYSDTMTVYHADSTGRILRSINLTPPRNFENFAIEDLLALPGGSFIAIYSGGDCDAGGYGYYVEARDTTGQLLWLSDLTKGYTFQAVGIGIDSQILISADNFVTKYSAVDGSILWQAEHNDTYTNNLLIVPGTEDILLVDHTGLKYFKQDTIAGEIAYHLETFTPLTASQGSIGILLAEGDSLFYAYTYLERKLFKFKKDLQPTLFATVPKNPQEMVAGNKGVYTIIFENHNSTKLYFIDSTGNQLLLNQFKDSGLRPQKLLSHRNGAGLIGSYGSGPELPFLPGYNFLSRGQAWFKYSPQYDFDNPADSVDLAITEILQQDSIHYVTFWSDGPTPAYLHNFEGGNFKVEITNHGNVVATSVWVNIAFGENLNTWFCPPTSVKQVFVDHLEVLPGSSVWIEFGDIFAYSQAQVPDQYCFWTSGPNHLPDYFPANDAHCIDRIVAVPEIQYNFFSVSPNPADGVLLVEWKEDFTSNPSWTIADVFGRVMLRGHSIPSAGPLSIGLMDLPSGVYIFSSGSLSKIIAVQH